ncbi:MAG: class I SAM-dependent methyltransferase, partial [Acidobacteria bacterium]|nr:class I SAM-dependent methyltransferase [Acidobacteriota bacterium]
MHRRPSEPTPTSPGRPLVTARPDGERLARPWEPLGRALLDYLDGDLEAAPVVSIDGGLRHRFPAAELFRAEGLPPAEELALDLARGRVLDAGAGAGAHALLLEAQGLEVVALDLSPLAAEVMRRRGLRDVRCGDLLALRGETFDTILLLMNGAGLAGDLAGLEPFLERCRRLLRPAGCLLVDSSDLRTTSDPNELAILTERLRRGRYFGEVIFRMEYRDLVGEPFPWLFVDARTLR